MVSSLSKFVLRSALKEMVEAAEGDKGTLERLTLVRPLVHVVWGDSMSSDA